MSNDGGDTHTVGVDECISSIAGQYGFFWKTLWFHPNNASLRSLRKDPNVLMEGDEIYIPEKTVKEEERPTDKKHTFIRKGIPSKFRIRILLNQEPRKNEPYVLVLDGKLIHGQTDGDGLIDIFIPPGSQQGKLSVGQGKTQQTFDLDFGHLNPVSEPSGAIHRLENLGYDCGLNKEKGLPQALRSFQAQNGLAISGTLDDATKSKLVEVHGS